LSKFFLSKIIDEIVLETSLETAEGKMVDEWSRLFMIISMTVK
jgi:hypothetical protein